MVIEGASKFDYKTCKLLFDLSLDAIYPLVSPCHVFCGNNLRCHQKESLLRLRPKA